MITQGNALGIKHGLRMIKMSKLCDRTYGDGSMYSKVMVDGISKCPNCANPTKCHGQTIDSRALFWSMMNDRGVSSEAIARHMTGLPTLRMMPPSDADDRGRCIRLLELIPEWINRLPEMVQYDQRQPQEGIVINSAGVSAYSNSWQKQIPIILREGKF